MIRNTLKNICLVLGACLFFLNIYGLFVSHQYPFDTAGFAIATEAERTAAYSNSLLMLERARDLPFEQKVATATEAIHSGIMHYWPKKGASDPGLRVPLSKNFILHFISYFDQFLEKAGYQPYFFTNYQIQNHRDMLERGIGLCDMQSIALAGFLDELGVPASIVCLNGHVVVAVKYPKGNNYILDPDYGIALPMSLPEAEDTPDKVKNHYLAKGYTEKTAQHISALFISKDNKIIEGGVERYNPTLYRLEGIANIAKWLLPAILIVAAFFLRRKTT